MADATSIKFYGLMGLVGKTVAVWCCALDCGDYVVASDGSVTVPFGSDPDGLFIPGHISSFDGPDYGPLGVVVDIWYDNINHNFTIPLAIGFPYTAQGQVLRPSAENEVKSARGSGLGKMRNITQIGVLLDSAIGVSFGTDFSSLTPADFRDDAGVTLDQATMFSGVWRQVIVDNGDFDSEICWESTRPYPLVVVSLTGYTEMQEP